MSAGLMLRRIVIKLLIAHFLWAGHFVSVQIRWSVILARHMESLRDNYASQKRVVGPLMWWWIAPQVCIQDLGPREWFETKWRTNWKHRLFLYDPTLTIET